MTQLMGLFVVGRLSQRHGITVQLQGGEAGGLVAYIRLAPGLARPVDITSLSDPTPAPQPALPASSPIFDALQSEWFTPRSAGAAPVPAAAAAQPEPSNWRSPADEGWRAAAAAQASATQTDLKTNAGLPQRVPGRNLIPGSAGRSAGTAGGSGNGATGSNGAAAGAAGGVRNGSGATRHRAPADARGLSSYQQGINRGRSEGREAPTGNGANGANGTGPSGSHAAANGSENGTPDPGSPEARRPGRPDKHDYHEGEEIRR